MNNTHRKEIITTLTRHATSLSKTASINDMILLHEQALTKFYCRKPLFYKMLFKHFRFYVTSVLISYYYCKPQATLKSAKVFIRQHQQPISNNTLNSLLMLLRVSGRLEIFENATQRQRFYRPSASMKHEIYDLIQSLLSPWRHYYTTTNRLVHEGNVDILLPQFFSGYINLIRNHVTIIDLLPEVAPFINKDGGHMVLLIMYTEYVRQKSHRIMLSFKKIAGYSHVSRAHICSLLKEAQSKGYIVVENNLFIRLSDKFILMFESYFCLYLAMILHSINITQAPAPSIGPMDQPTNQ